MRTTTGYTGQARLLVALSTAVAVLATACGSTAYRDRIEIAGDDAAIHADPGETIAIDLDGDGEVEQAIAVDTDGDGEADQVEVASGSAPSGSTSSATSYGTSPGTTTDEGSTSNTNSGSGTSPNGGTTQPDEPAASDDPNEGGQDQPEVIEPGLTEDTIRVGFITVTSTREFEASLSFSNSDKGDVEQQIDTLVAWINDNGGVAGRMVEPYVQEYLQEEASPEREAEMCNAFADDDETWAVVLRGQIHGSTRACYSGKQVTMLDAGAFIFDDDLIAENSPYMFHTGYPNYARVVRALVPSLVERDFFEPMVERGETEVNVGILHWDAPAEKRILETDMLPTLAQYGIEPAVTHGVDPSSAGTIQNGLANAVIRFRGANVNRVLFIGGSPLAPFFFLNAETSGYRPRYGMTTVDAPRHTANNDSTKAQMTDAIGIGFGPVNDVLADEYPFPSPENETEQLCMQVLEQGGHDLPDRNNAQDALAYCESLLLLKRAADPLGDHLNHISWAQSVEQMGSFQPASGFAGSFGPGKHDAGDMFRPIQHFDDCECFKYTGPEQRL